MDEITQLQTQTDYRALITLKGARHRLTGQQYKTLRGQVLAGNADGAMKGLREILLGGGSNAVKLHR